MTVWLTLLLVWTTGIPAAVFAAATLGARLHERRLTRIAGMFTPRGLAPGRGQLCHRRLHSYGVGISQPHRRVAGRRR
jgi:hypothetical protein